MKTSALTIAISAGEASGDQLGSGLMRALYVLKPNTRFIGIAGPSMREAGCLVLGKSEMLSVMGGIEIWTALLRIYRIKKRFVTYLEKHPPDVLVTIDAPDFHLPIAHKLRKKGIKTVHYVSPSVWAWRKNRIYTVNKAVSLLLHLFPFEAQYYQQLPIKCICVGHPVADRPFVTSVSKQAAKQRLGYDPKTELIGCFPGSRRKEIELLLEPFLSAASILFLENPNCRFHIGLADTSAEDLINATLKQRYPDLPVQVTISGTGTLMEAADAAFVASGTATLELFFSHTPMVIAYRLHPITYWMARKWIKLRHIGLPNLLLNEELIAECIQEHCTPDQLALQIKKTFSPTYKKRFIDRALFLKKSLQSNTHQKAAITLLNYLTHTSAT